MAIIKCKMCGGDLSITEGATVTECEYCGTTQTVPKVDDEKKLTLFSRANRLRQANEFDKAAGVYENLVADFPTEAEAYWGLVLCRYGIEYVDDPATGKKVPTCHRSSFDSILEDSDFEQACENADAIARRVYREEAKAIENIRKGIIEVSGKEPPYDIFICYKETAEDGQRTIDSVLAQDVYDALTGKGYRVFFSRITLEDKLGTEYEPYIFAALNSAKVMLVFGTDYEYFNAVWVKNEWSRFLKLMAQDKSKHLIPCYKDVDAYDMPKEFQKLQAQDMGKVGAVQDLLRGIDKLLGKGQAAPAAQPAPVQVVSAGGPTVDSLLKRAQILLEDRDWKSANEYLDKVLEIDPECAEAYLGKFCAEMEYTNPEMMAQDTRPLKDSRNKANALRFASPELRAQLEKYQQSAEEKARQDAEKARQEAERKRSILAPIRPLVQGMLLGISGDTFGLRADGTVLAMGDNEKGQCNVSDWRDIVAITAGDEHTVGLRADGTVVAVGNNKDGQCNVSDWQDIVAIVAGYSHTVGLRADGTVVAVGYNGYGQCNVSDWQDIVAIAAGPFHTVGLRAGGTVVAVGNNKDGQCNVSDWRDIVAITAGDEHTVGLRADGTVVAVGNNKDGQRNVSDWQDIVAIAADSLYKVGLRADGTVVAVGENEYGQCNVSDWQDIVAIAVGIAHTVGLRADGTVVAVGDNEYGECNVSDWQEIVAIAAGPFHTAGLRADGTVVVACKSGDEMQEKIKDWKLFDSVEQLKEQQEALQQRGEQMRQERRRQEEEEKHRRQEERRKKEEARTALETERARLQTELANLKGFFTGKRRKEIEARLAEIEAELKKL